ncbi:MAG: Gmad2 immunoglobulin-like domain-containing protein [Patescibacteria group bacterium]|nr:Gmad2 immunoglobulin-like domain-containing protein [Patescibacteria group bacterium]
MQNKITKPEPTISFSNLPSIIAVVIFIVGIGAVFGLLGYLVSGIKENITPVAQKPPVKITDKTADNYFGNDFIQVKSPQKNATIKNPVLISGKANVDEANVRVKITDDNENILADTFITADGWMDKLYPFEKEINYEIPQTENGLIEIFEESAKDGSEIYKIKVPVVFEEYEDAFKFIEK